MWRRFWAAGIDLMIVGCCSVAVSWIFFDFNTTGEPSNGAGVLQLLLWFVYFVGMDYFYGGTIGKRWLGLRVALPQMETQEIVLFLVLRALMRIVCLPLSIIYALFVIWSPNGRSLTDFVSQGLVVDAQTLTPPKKPRRSSQVVATILSLVFPLLALLFLLIVFCGFFLVLSMILLKGIV